MSKTDPNLRAKLQRSPTYQRALRGEWWAEGMPHTPGFQAEHLRAAARMDGIEIPSGYKFDRGSGSFIDANADHWYSDPRVLGPAAVAAGGAAGALFGAPAGAAPGIPALGNVNANAAHAAAAASGGAASGGVTAALKNLVPNSARDIVGLAGAAVPLIAGAGNANPFSDDEEQALLDEIRRGMALQRQRVEQTQPVFEDLVRRTQASAPNATYGGPAYQYQGPRFGR
jgi:hypothetical protein